MRKVLIITYYWPPASSPGVFRFLKFSKYFPEFGYEPVILTVKNGSYPSIDESLLDEVNPGVEIYRSKTVEPFSLFNSISGKKGKSLPVAIMPDKKDSPIKKLMFFARANLFIPDARKGWNFFAYKKAKRIIREKKISHVITTGPPHSTHLIGLRLKKECKIKWLADFRDPWTNIYYNKYFPRTRKTRKKDYLLESIVLEKADFVTVVSKGMRDEFIGRAPRIEVIQNGFDEKDMERRTVKATNFFYLSYIGNLKANQNINILWQAIAELIGEYPGFKDFFRLRLTGNTSDAVFESLHDHSISEIAEIEKYVPHSTAINRMVESNLLLFIVPRAKNNKMIITGKLFEYLASNAPVLSIGPIDGEAASIVKLKKRNEMIDYDDKRGMKNKILDYFKNWEKDKKLEIAEKVDLWEYSRKGLTEKMASILNSLKNGSEVSPFQ